MLPYKQVQYSQRNLAANSMRKFIVSHDVNQNGAPIAYGTPMELRDVVMYCPSPSGQAQYMFFQRAIAVQILYLFSWVCQSNESTATADADKEPRSGPVVVLPRHEADMCALATGACTLVVRAEKEGAPVTMEVWGHHGVVRELQIPAGLHGAVLNDGWFSNGVAWDPAERRVAYVAEVRTLQHHVANLHPVDPW